MAADRADEPDAALCPGQAVEPGHAVILRLGFKLRQFPAYQVAGDEGLRAEVFAVHHGHQLDKAQVHRVLPGQLRQGGDLVVVKAADEHRIDLHLVKARIQCGVDAPQGLLQAAPAGDVGIFLCVQGVQADVHPADPGFPQRSGQLRQQGAVGGDADLLNALRLGNTPADGQDIPLDQGLAPGDAKLGDPQLRRSLHGGEHLLLGQHVLMPFFADPILGHTIATAQVAQLRHRQAQIGDFSSVSVDQKETLRFFVVFYIIFFFRPQYKSEKCPAADRYASKRKSSHHGEHFSLYAFYASWRSTSCSSLTLGRM